MSPVGVACDTQRLEDGLLTVFVRALVWALGIVAGTVLLWFASQVVAPMPAVAATRDVQLVAQSTSIAAAGPPNPGPTALTAEEGEGGGGDAGGEEQSEPADDGGGEQESEPADDGGGEQESEPADDGGGEQESEPADQPADDAEDQPADDAEDQPADEGTDDDVEDQPADDAGDDVRIEQVSDEDTTTGSTDPAADPADPAEDVTAEDVTNEGTVDLIDDPESDPSDGPGTPTISPVRFEGPGPMPVDPDAEDPSTTDPGMADPGMADPDLTEPGTTDPDMTDPDMTDPDMTEPGQEDGAGDDGAGDDGAGEDSVINAEMLNRAQQGYSTTVNYGRPALPFVEQGHLSDDEGVPANPGDSEAPLPGDDTDSDPEGDPATERGPPAGEDVSPEGEDVSPEGGARLLPDGSIAAPTRDGQELTITPPDLDAERDDAEVTPELEQRRHLITIHGPDAPTDYDFGVDAPDDNTVEVTDDGGADVRTTDGELNARIAEPWAYDANGEAVDTSFAYDDTSKSLTQNVAHGPGSAYPILADPFIEGDAATGPPPGDAPAVPPTTTPPTTTVPVDGPEPIGSPSAQNRPGPPGGQSGPGEGNGVPYVPPVDPAVDPRSPSELFPEEIAETPGRPVEPIEPIEPVDPVDPVEPGPPGGQSGPGEGNGVPYVPPVDPVDPVDPVIETVSDPADQTAAPGADDTSTLPAGGEDGSDDAPLSFQVYEAPGTGDAPTNQVVRHDEGGAPDQDENLAPVEEPEAPVGTVENPGPYTSDIDHGHGQGANGLFYDPDTANRLAAHSSPKTAEDREEEGRRWTQYLYDEGVIEIAPGEVQAGCSGGVTSEGCYSRTVDESGNITSEHDTRLVPVDGSTSDEDIDASQEGVVAGNVPGGPQAPSQLGVTYPGADGDYTGTVNGPGSVDLDINAQTGELDLDYTGDGALGTPQNQQVDTKNGGSITRDGFDTPTTITAGGTGQVRGARGDGATFTGLGEDGMGGSATLTDSVNGGEATIEFDGLADADPFSGDGTTARVVGNPETGVDATFVAGDDAGSPDTLDGQNLAGTPDDPTAWELNPTEGGTYSGGGPTVAAATEDAAENPLTLEFAGWGRGDNGEDDVFDVAGGGPDGQAGWTEFTDRNDATGAEGELILRNTGLWKFTTQDGGSFGGPGGAPDERPDRVTTHGADGSPASYDILRGGGRFGEGEGSGSVDGRATGTSQDAFGAPAVVSANGRGAYYIKPDGFTETNLDPQGNVELIGAGPNGWGGEATCVGSCVQGSDDGDPATPDLPVMMAPSGTTLDETGQPVYQPVTVDRRFATSPDDGGDVTVSNVWSPGGVTVASPQGSQSYTPTFGGGGGVFFDYADTQGSGGAMCLYGSGGRCEGSNTDGSAYVNNDGQDHLVLPDGTLAPSGTRLSFDGGWSADQFFGEGSDPANQQVPWRDLSPAELGYLDPTYLRLPNLPGEARAADQVVPTPSKPLLSEPERLALPPDQREIYDATLLAPTVDIVGRGGLTYLNNQVDDTQASRRLAPELPAVIDAIDAAETDGATPEEQAELVRVITELEAEHPGEYKRWMEARGVLDGVDRAGYVPGDNTASTQIGPSTDPAVIAALVDGYDPSVAPTDEQIDAARTELTRLQGAVPTESLAVQEYLDSPDVVAVNTDLDDLNARIDEFNANPGTEAEADALNAELDLLLVRRQEVNNHLNGLLANADGTQSTLSEVDMLLAQASGDPDFAAAISGAGAGADTARGLLANLPVPTTAEEAAYQNALLTAAGLTGLNYNTVEAAPRSLINQLDQARLPSTLYPDIPLAQQAAVSIPDHAAADGLLADARPGVVFGSVTPENPEGTPTTRLWDQLSPDEQTLIAAFQTPEQFEQNVLSTPEGVIWARAGSVEGAKADSETLFWTADDSPWTAGLTPEQRTELQAMTQLTDEEARQGILDQVQGTLPALGEAAGTLGDVVAAGLKGDGDEVRAVPEIAALRESLGYGPPPEALPHPEGLNRTTHGAADFVGDIPQMGVHFVEAAGAEVHNIGALSYNPIALPVGLPLAPMADGGSLGQTPLPDGTMVDRSGGPDSIANPFGTLDENAQLHPLTGGLAQVVAKSGDRWNDALLNEDWSKVQNDYWTGTDPVTGEPVNPVMTAFEDLTIPGLAGGVTAVGARGLAGRLRDAAAAELAPVRRAYDNGYPLTAADEAAFARAAQLSGQANRLDALAGVAMLPLRAQAAPFSLWGHAIGLTPELRALRAKYDPYQQPRTVDGEVLPGTQSTATPAPNPLALPETPTSYAPGNVLDSPSTSTPTPGFQPNVTFDFGPWNSAPHLSPPYDPFNYSSFYDPSMSQIAPNGPAGVAGPWNPPREPSPPSGPLPFIDRESGPNSTYAIPGLVGRSPFGEPPSRLPIVYRKIGTAGPYFANPGFRISPAERAQLGQEFFAPWQIADMNAIIARNPSLAGIAPEELLAVREYTQPHYYRGLNSSLREDNKHPLGYYDGWIRSATSGLNQLPVFEGWTVRGTDPLSEAALRRYQPGAVVVEGEFLSASITHPLRHGVRFEILSRTGRVLGDVSSLTAENEVIFPPGTSFRVLDADLGGPVPKITMQEIPGPSSIGGPSLPDRVDAPQGRRLLGEHLSDALSPDGPIRATDLGLTPSEITTLVQVPELAARFNYFEYDGVGYVQRLPQPPNR